VSHILPNGSWDEGSRVAGPSRVIADDRVRGPRDDKKRSKSKWKSTTECPHPDCSNKLRTSFSRRKNLVRHYMSHVKHDTLCILCGWEGADVQQYVNHSKACESKAKRENCANISPNQINEVIRQRREMLKMTGRRLDEQLSTLHNNEAASGGLAGTKRRRATDTERTSPCEVLIMENQDPDAAAEDHSSRVLPPEDDIPRSLEPKRFAGHVGTGSRGWICHLPNERQAYLFVNRSDTRT